MSDIRLIDANALKKTFIKWSCADCHFRTSENPTDICCDDCYAQAIKDLIDNAPTVDAIVNTIEARPQGEWYYSIDKGWECNQCHEIVKDMPTCMRKALYNFCPNCGAELRKGGAE